MTEEFEPLSCDREEYRKKLCELSEGKRIAVTFVGKEFPATESYIEALSRADEQGFFGEMKMAVQTVENEECYALAEAEGVEELPTTVVYECVAGELRVVDRVVPKEGYQKAVERLIDLSEA